MQLKCKSCSNQNLYHPPKRKTVDKVLKCVGVSLYRCPACRSRAYYFAPVLHL